MQAGDLVLCRSRGIIGAGIRWSQRRLGDSRYAQWNHVAILDHEVDGKWYVIQAEASGVTNDKFLESVAPGGTYEIVGLPTNCDREKFLAFARGQVGAKYGYLSICSCALDMALPDSICLRKSKTWICSGLVAGSLWFAGYPDAMEWPDLYTITPAEIAQSCSAI